MPLVVDANVVISALVADSTTRELVVTIDPDLLTPEVIRAEIGKHEDVVVEKSGLDAGEVAQLIELLFRHIELLFRHIEVVPAREFYPYVERARGAIGETDPDDVLYLACALARDADLWSDDADFEEQSLVPVYTTRDVIESFGTA